MIDLHSVHMTVLRTADPLDFAGFLTRNRLVSASFLKLIDIRRVNEFIFRTCKLWTSTLIFVFVCFVLYG